jgi:hypothetical protein
VTNVNIAAMATSSPGDTIRFVEWALDGNVRLKAHARQSDVGVDLMSEQMRRVGLALSAMLAVTGNANGQVIPMSFAEIVNAADTIVVAEAIDSRAEWVTTGSSRVIVTRMTFRVADTLKGTQRLLLPLEFLGGTIGDVGFEVSGVPTFDIGDRAVLFVSGARAASPIVGHMQGRFPISTAPDGTDYVTLHDRRAFSAVNQISAPVTVSPVVIPTMTLEAFQTEIGGVLQDPSAR